jgi:hypothetical protein
LLNRSTHGSRKAAATRAAERDATGSRTRSDIRLDWWPHGGVSLYARYKPSAIIDRSVHTLENDQ